MSAGMAEVIAEHPGHEIRLDDQLWVQVCFGCPWRYRYSDGSGLEAHAAHVAEELAKAGYGLVPNVAPEYGAQMMTHGGRSGQPIGHGPERNPNWWNKSTHMRLVGPWQELEPLPGPHAAALGDPEGRALVQAIHDAEPGAWVLATAPNAKPALAHRCHRASP